MFVGNELVQNGTNLFKDQTCPKSERTVSDGKASKIAPFLAESHPSTHANKQPDEEAAVARHIDRAG